MIFFEHRVAEGLKTGPDRKHPFRINKCCLGTVTGLVLPLTGVLRTAYRPAENLRLTWGWR